jgi:hypothetical protein
MIKKRAPAKVRPVKPEDYDAWKPLWDEYNAFYERTGPTALPEEVTETLWRRFFDGSEPVYCIVAERDDKVVGLCHYIYHRSTSRIEPLCYLQDLFTAPTAASACTGRHISPIRPAAPCTTRSRNTSASSSTRRMFDEAAEAVSAGARVLQELRLPDVP